MNNKFENKETKSISTNNQKNQKKAVPIYKLFKYSKWLDIFLIVFGSLAAVCSGSIMPLSMLFFTNIVDSFTSYGTQNCNQTSFNFTNSNETNSFDLNEKLHEQAIYLVGFASVATFLSYLRISCWVISAERQSRMIRKKLFNSILSQEIEWFDSIKSGELTSRLTDDIDRIRDCLGDKFSNFIQLLATFFSGMMISLIKGWKLTMVILSLSPLLFICSVLFTKITESLSKNELKSYASAGAVAEEVLRAIKTVFAFNGSQIEHKRYETKLDESKKYGIKKGIITGLLFAIVSIVTNSAYALGFWYGWTLTEDRDYSVGKIIFIFYSIIQAVSSLANAIPFITNLAQARAAAFEVFNLIDKKTKIDSNTGDKLTKLNGEIEFKHVNFNYSSQPDVRVLNDLNFKIKSGQTIAFVGSSGCGKSTCIQLLQRFYEPDSGSILIDDKDLKLFNLNWIRSQIGVVSQEANLFNATIYENIKYGRENATENEIIEAAKQANAHEFIMELPLKYQTELGNMGSQLSGGQKQRIAIARALVRDPKILLLDEATSALDNVSESVVQAALNKARVGRTTIIVAHRLSTIKNASMIFCFNKGSIIESGTHEQLMNLNGRYYSLVINQETFTATNESLIKKNTKENDISVELNETSKKRISEFEKIDYPTKHKENKIGLRRVMSLNKPEWIYILIGCAGCIISGSSNPVFSIVLSKVISIFQECDLSLQSSQIKLYCITFLLIGGVTFISNFILNVMFAISGENMTKRLRSDCFKAMLRQDLEWFDMPENNVGFLTTRLATETAAVQKATGFRLGNILMNLSNLGVAILLAFITSWTISLTIIAFVPLMFLSGVLQTKLVSGYVTREKNVSESAGKLSNEVISNIKIVAILNKQEFFSNVYSELIDSSYRDSIKLANINGLMIGFISSIMVFAIAAAFVLGGYLVENNLFDLNFEKIMRVFSCLFYGAQSITEAASLMPDYAKSKVAISNIFKLIDRVPKIDNWPNLYAYNPINQFKNTSIQFDSVEFAYPNRPEVNVLKSFNLQIKHRQRVGLVGSSGSGKSTITSLIERFYDPNTGDVKIGGVNLKEYDLNYLRSQIGIVSQETILFDRTIAENIAYGDNSRQVELKEIIEVSKKANIHDFISNLPMGYSTRTNQLSGGQKQRICIARALIKNPQILVLDEATSALDIESEKQVQIALDEAQKDCTCVTIAHRLGTIKNSDVIYVLQNGIIIEHGKHQELIEQNGFYAKLNSSLK